MIALSLPVGDNHGWGICGSAIRRVLGEGNYLDLSNQNPQISDYPVVTRLPMLHTIQGTNLLPSDLTRHSATRNVGLCFIEESELVKKYVPNGLRWFDHIITGSTWCTQVLLEAGLPNVSTALQGVDTQVFKPRTPADDEYSNFVIFTGGKMEFRKGTDVAMKAIGIMMQEHGDVVAVAAWFNPWRESRATMAQSQVISWDGNLESTLTLAGIDRTRLLGPVDQPITHAEMAGLYYRSHIGLFPNRVEAGTNLVMSEFMACGKPVIAMCEHGHMDVVNPDSVFTLEKNDTRISAVKRGDLVQPVAKYWEPDLDEVVFNLEYAYQRWEMGEGLWDAPNRARMLEMTWSGCVESILEACEA